MPRWESNRIRGELSSSGGSVVKKPPARAEDAGDTGSIPWSGRSPGGGNGNPLQHSCLDNPMDRGAWRATVCGVIKSWTWLSDWTLEIATVFYYILIQKYEVLREECWNFTAGEIVTGTLIHSFAHFHSLTGHTHASKWNYSCARYISLIPLNVIFLPLHTVLCALKDWVQWATC